MSSEYVESMCKACSGPIMVVNPEWLSEKRRLSGLTFRVLAKKIGVSAAYLCDIEMGRRSVPETVHACYGTLRASRPPRRPRPEGT